MFAKLDEFGILDVIVVDDYWNRKVLHGLEIEQRAPVCMSHSVTGPGPSAALQSAGRPMLHAASQAPPLLNILCAHSVRTLTHH